MNEVLRLANGQEYNLPVNGINLFKNVLHITIVIPNDTPLGDIKDVFKNKSNTAEVQTVINGKVKQIHSGYTELGSSLTLNDNAVIGVSVNENEDGTSSTETLYGTTVELQLSKESVETKVEVNRADIDYLLMMEDTAV